MSQHTDPQAADILDDQRRLYDGGFYRHRRWRWSFRDDCRYRYHRLKELLPQLGFSLHQRRVLEVGFGSGDLLLMFPTSCKLMGVELSAAAVDAVRSDPRLRLHQDHWFTTVDPDGALPRPPEPADIIVTSHVLEHVPDDRALLGELLPHLSEDGLLVTFVPLERPGFDPKHVRTYNMASVARLMADLDLQVLHHEANYQICWGPMRWMDHAARHGWPGGTGLEALRNVLLTAIPHETTRAVENLLVQLGAPATQAMVVATPQRG